MHFGSQRQRTHCVGVLHALSAYTAVHYALSTGSDQEGSEENEYSRGNDRRLQVPWFVLQQFHVWQAL